MFVPVTVLLSLPHTEKRLRCRPYSHLETAVSRIRFLFTITQRENIAVRRTKYVVSGPASCRFAPAIPYRDRFYCTSHTCFPLNIYTDELLLRIGQAAVAGMLGAPLLQEQRRWRHRAFHSSDGSKISMCCIPVRSVCVNISKLPYMCQALACLHTRHRSNYCRRRELTHMPMHTCPYIDAKSLARSHANAWPPRALEVRTPKTKVHDVFDRNYMNTDV